MSERGTPTFGDLLVLVIVGAIWWAWERFKALFVEDVPSLEPSW